MNDNTKDCSDGSDEDDDYDYDYDENIDDGYDYDDNEDLKAIVSGSSIDLNTIKIPTSNTLKLKVMQ